MIPLYVMFCYLTSVSINNQCPITQLGQNLEYMSGNELGKRIKLWSYKEIPRIDFNKSRDLNIIC